MPRRGGWTRKGRRKPFRYLDSRGNRITDPAMLERIESLVIPPAWQDVWISPRASAKLQATGIDSAGRRQYLYHPDFRAEREQAKFDKLVRFADRLPGLREAMAEHMALDELAPERVSARRPATDQPRLVPRRLRALRPYLADVRNHHPPQAPREGARKPCDAQLSRQGKRARPCRRGGCRARLGCARAARARGRKPALPLSPERRPAAP